ncbi:MAG TPA: YdcF family protein [Terriglobales bacterium]|nr:YdcF family protein [Terriglobales bacterium]
MKEPPVKRSPRSYWPLWLMAFVIAAVAVCLIFIGKEIISESTKQEVHSADAIVVFGAAEYAGRPSPVLRARLDHAFDLFQRGVAPIVITTGGAAADPSFSEGGVGHDYLMHHGIPDADLIAETQGSDTAHSAQRVGIIMRTNHMRSCVAVSDAYHVFRIRKLLEHEGVQVSVAPRPDSIPHSMWMRSVALLRESASYMLWKMHIPA